MKIVLFPHYAGFRTVSMPLFANMITTGMRAEGHQVDVWACPVIAGRLSRHSGLSKWLGYLDQFVFFPAWVRLRLLKTPRDTLFVITDQALGPWVPLVRHRPHIIHCHDFIAQHSALGRVPENQVSRSGRLYQAFIRRGYRKGRHFICVSQETQRDLHAVLQIEPPPTESNGSWAGEKKYRSCVIYNGLNYPYQPITRDEALKRLAVQHQTNEHTQGFILHVGGNQYYKNRLGVVAAYAAYVANTPAPLPLWCVGQLPTAALEQAAQAIPSPGVVRFITGLTTPQVEAAYRLARVLFFPSLAEGFGWPIAEAQACGCPVLTTDQAPMTEVGGRAARYLPRLTLKNQTAWPALAAKALSELLVESSLERERRQLQGSENAQRFTPRTILSAYETCYRSIVDAGCS